MITRLILAAVALVGAVAVFMLVIPGFANPPGPSVIDAVGKEFQRRLHGFFLEQSAQLAHQHWEARVAQNI